MGLADSSHGKGGGERVGYSWMGSTDVGELDLWESLQASKEVISVTEVPPLPYDSVPCVPG